MENFNVLKALLEGNLADENMAASIKDGTATTHSLRTLGTGASQALGFVQNLASFASQPAAGATALFTYTEAGINFPTACLLAFLTGWQVYQDAGHTEPTSQPFNAAVGPSGKNVAVTFQNGSGKTLYPSIGIVAIGH